MNANIDISNVVLKTDRLILRPFNENDLNDFYEYAKVPGVGEMAGWLHHESIDETKKILKFFIDEKKVLAIVKDNKVIGSIGVEDYSEKDFPKLKDKNVRELGFVLSKDYWGQGIVVEACKAIIDYLFNDVGLDYIICGHFTENNQSARVQEKLGFKYYCNYQYNSFSVGPKDAIVSILSKENWNKKY